MNKKKPAYNKKLTPRQVKRIREEYLDGYTQESLAEYYGVSKKTIYDIVHLYKYKDVDIPLPLEEYFEIINARKYTKRSK